MQKIAALINGSPVTTSLAIAEGVGKNHKNVLELIRKYVGDLEEFGRLAFETRKGEPLLHGGFGKTTEFANLNERQATLLFTYMRNTETVREFKKRLVKSFYELASHNPTPSSLSRMDILKMAIESEEKRVQLENKVANDAPKVEFHDKVVASEEAISVSEAAKILGTGRKRLFATLRHLGWVTRRNEPYQIKITAGYMDVKLGSWNHPEHGLQNSVTALITGKGLAKLQRVMALRMAS